MGVQAIITYKLFCLRGGGGSRRVGWGEGFRWGNLRGACPQGQALIQHRHPLPTLAFPLTIPSP